MEKSEAPAGGPRRPFHSRFWHRDLEARASLPLGMKSCWPSILTRDRVLATTRTSMPVFVLNSGRMWPNCPESWSDMVEATTIDFSRA